MTGSSLLDRYPVEPRELWSAVLRKEYERIALHPDDLRYEALEPARIQPGNVFGLVYEDLILALRHELTPREDRPTPVFPFAYDWRQSLDRIAGELDAMVEEVIDRTRLLRHYQGFAEQPQVDLVGHSVGGLAICEYLAAHGHKRRVRRVATLATPFRGSIEAVVKLVTGLGHLSGYPPSEREREAARSTPALYQLLPSYEGCVREVATGASVDLFTPESWQPSIVDSLAEFIRLHAVERANARERRQRAFALLGRLLAEARRHRERVDGLALREAGLEPDAWLAVAGVGAPTRVEIGIELENGRPRFALSPEQWVDQGPESTRTGDGTVSVLGAIPAFLGAERVVGVVPADFEAFEIGDRAMLGKAGFHALLPNLNLAQRLVVRHLRPGFRGPVSGRPVAGVGAGDWTPPFRL